MSLISVNSIPRRRRAAGKHYCSYLHSYDMALWQEYVKDAPPFVHEDVSYDFKTVPASALSSNPFRIYVWNVVKAMKTERLEDIRIKRGLAIALKQPVELAVHGTALLRKLQNAGIKYISTFIDAWNDHKYYAEQIGSVAYANEAIMILKRAGIVTLARKQDDAKGDIIATVKYS